MKQRLQPQEETFRSYLGTKNGPEWANGEKVQAC